MFASAAVSQEPYLLAGWMSRMFLSVLKRSLKVLTYYVLVQCPSCCVMDNCAVALKYALNTEAFRRGIYSSVFKPPQQHTTLWSFCKIITTDFSNVNAIDSIVCSVVQPEHVKRRKVAASLSQSKIECNISVIVVSCIKYCCTVQQWIAGDAVPLLTRHKFKSLKN